MRPRGVKATAAAAVIAAVVLVMAAPVSAGGTADAWTSDETIGAEARTPARLVSTTQSRARTSEVVCTHIRLGERDARDAELMSDLGLITSQPGSGEGSWYQRECTAPDGASQARLIWLPDTSVDPETLAQQALGRADAPLPSVGMSPPPDRGQVVHVETWLWLEGGWAPVTASASAGGVTATVTATPERVEWDMGNGDVVVCAGPGTAYDHDRPADAQQPSCAYTYRRSSAHAPGGAYQVTATVVWTVTWSAAGAPGGGSLGELRSSSTVPVRVAEVQALNR